jgi:hypothetical protein
MTARSTQRPPLPSIRVAARRLAPGEAELKSRNQAPVSPPAQSLRDRHGLACRDRGNDQIGLRREIGMGIRQCDTMRRGVIAQSCGLTVVEFEIAGDDP